MTADESPERYRDPEAWPYTFEILDLDWLFVDERYQRPLTRMADEIADGLNRAMLEPLLVSRRDKRRYAIADGQNRWAGMKRIGERWAWCRVMVLTPQEEAKLFSDLQSKRKNISPLERYKADLFSGDEEAVNVDLLLRRHGVHASGVSGAYSSEDALTAIIAVRRGWTRYGDDAMDRVFETIKAAFPGQRGRYSGDVINGMLQFFARNKDIDQPRLIAAFTDEIGNLHELKARSVAKRRATGAGMGGGSAVYTVRVIEEAYRRIGRKPFRKAWQDVPPQTY